MTSPSSKVVATHAAVNLTKSALIHGLMCKYLLCLHIWAQKTKSASQPVYTMLYGGKCSWMTLSSSILTLLACIINTSVHCENPTHDRTYSFLPFRQHNYVARFRIRSPIRIQNIGHVRSQSNSRLSAQMVNEMVVTFANTYSRTNCYTHPTTVGALTIFVYQFGEITL